MITLYHGTYQWNLEDILRDGLQIRYSGVHGYDHRPSVFLGTREQAQDFSRALYPNGCVLKVSLPDDFPLTEDLVHYGIVSLQDIPAAYIWAGSSGIGVRRTLNAFRTLQTSTLNLVTTGNRIPLETAFPLGQTYRGNGNRMFPCKPMKTSKSIENNNIGTLCREQKW